MTNQEIIILRILLQKALRSLDKEHIETVKKTYEKALLYLDQDFVKKVFLGEK